MCRPFSSSPTAGRALAWRGFRKAAPVLMTGLAAWLTAAGCSHHNLESGWANHDKMQVQFYSPPGATVAVCDCVHGDRRHQVAQYGSDHRLEHSPEEFAVFNLCPKRMYEFKYTTAEGFPGVSIYGELEVHQPRSVVSRRFMEHAFIPISLPSRYYDRGEEFYYPSRGTSGVGLDALELEHLRQGDLIQKVYFVADLKKASDTIDAIDYHIEKLRSAETVLNTHLQFVDSRFQSYRRESLYSDPTSDSLARWRDQTGYNKEFISIEAQRQRLENERYKIQGQIEDLLNERRIRRRLLDTMKIVNRRGSLVLATPENQWNYDNTATQVSGARAYPSYVTGPFEDYKTGDIVIPALGDLMVVMRVGGRHMHWDDPRREMVAFRKK